MKIKSTSIFLLLSLCFVFSIIGSASPAKEGGALRVALAKDPVTLDPTMALDTYSMQVIDQVFDCLISYDEDGNLIPELATSWENPEPTKWIFHIRKGVKFHNGSKLTAEDVVWTMDRMLDPDTDAPRDRLYMVENVKATSEYEVEFILKEPFPPLLAILSNKGLSILPPEEVQEKGEEFARNPVGTGPFKFVSWVQDKNVTLERFEDYWAGKPNLEKVIFRPIPETSVAQMELLSGNLDVITDILPDDIERMKKKSNLQVTPGTGYYYLCINMHPEKTKVYEKTGVNPFANLKVRKAINLAFNVEKTIKSIYPGLGSSIRAFTPIPPSFESYNENAEKILPRYDLERAKELMKEAGYEDGFKTEILAMSDSARKRTAVILQSALKKLNIEASISAPQFGTLLQRANEGDFGIGVFGWSGAPDPHDYAYWLLDSKNWGSGGNNSFFKDERVDELLEEASTSTDQKLRKMYYREVQTIFALEVPHVPLFWSPNFLATTSRVHGLKVHFQGWIHLVGKDTNVWVD